MRQYTYIRTCIIACLHLYTETQLTSQLPEFKQTKPPCIKQVLGLNPSRRDFSLCQADDHMLACDWAACIHYILVDIQIV